MLDLAQRYQHVTNHITQAAKARGRSAQSIKLLAVSKTFDAELVETLFCMGQQAFGENYVKEAIVKIEALQALKHHRTPIEWHLIGPLQSNKTALVAHHFDWVQSVDRLKIAERLSQQRPAHLPLLNICIQVNVDGGQTKSGVDVVVSLQSLLDLVKGIQALPQLRLRGLMAIPEPQADAAGQSAVFTKVKAAFDAVNAALPAQQKIDTLSMGMSSDFPAAIAAGSTMVRVGGAIFGERPSAA